MSRLYILEINPLSVASIAIIFSHSESCLLILFIVSFAVILFIVSFAVRKLLSLIRSYLFIFVLIPWLWEVGQRGSCCDLCLGGSEVKAPACNAGDLGSIPGSERSPGEGNGNPLQYSCLENPMDGGDLWATVHRVAKSRIRLGDFTFTFLNPFSR